MAGNKLIIIIIIIPMWDTIFSTRISHIRNTKHLILDLYCISERLDAAVLSHGIGTVRLGRHGGHAAGAVPSPT